MAVPSPSLSKSSFSSSLVAQMVKCVPAIRETRVQSLGREDPGFNPCARKISWRRKWQLTPVFLPGKSHGWRNLIGYSPWGHKESDTTEQLPFGFHLVIDKKTEKTTDYPIL